MKINWICFTALILLSFGSNAEASNYKCTEWEKQDSVSCIFAGKSANIYKRQCENACWYNPVTRRGNMGPNCDQERVCHPENPETFSSECSEWVKVRGVTCYDPNTQDWEQKWQRACTVGIKESWCSRANPNDL